MNPSNPTVILTGASGFLGQNVAKFLSARGLRGILLDLKAPTDPDMVALVRRGDWRFHQCDFSAPDSLNLAAVAPGSLYLVHLASKVHTSNAITSDVAAEIETQVGGLFRLMKHIGLAIGGVVLASTIETYGLPVKLPINEAHPTDPFNVYGAAKLTLEYFLDIHCRQNAVPLAVLRLPQIYGPGDTYAKAIPTFIQNSLQRKPSSLVNDGADLREFVHVDDAGYAVFLAMERKSEGVFNITGGRSVSIGETLRLIQEICGTDLSPSNTSSNKQQIQYAFDISNARRELGYVPKVSFEEGLESEVQWFKERVT